MNRTVKTMALLILGSAVMAVTVTGTSGQAWGRTLGGERAALVEAPLPGAIPVIQAADPSAQAPDATVARERRRADRDGEGDRKRSSRKHQSDQPRQSDEPRQSDPPQTNEPQRDQPRRHCDEGEGTGVVCVDPIISVCVNCLLANIVL